MKMVKLLLKYKTDKTLKDKFQKTAFLYALEILAATLNTCAAVSSSSSYILSKCSFGNISTCPLAAGLASKITFTISSS